MSAHAQTNGLDIGCTTEHDALKGIANPVHPTLAASTSLITFGNQPYHNTGGGCCDDRGNFPSIQQLETMQHQSGIGHVRITLRDWYITNYCTDAVVQQMMSIQKWGSNNVTFWTRYLLFWSFFGDYLFYITVLPAFCWAGIEREGYIMAVMLSFGMYMTDTLKDVFAAPRPPCPPLRRGGHHGHSLEYGLPSTHACNVVILAFELAVFFSKAYPSAIVLVWLITAIFTAHVCFSRVWLGMHWPADIWAGFACAGVLLLMRQAFIYDFLNHCYDNYAAYPLAFPLLFGHVLLVYHATPRGTCPCFEDSARFLGVLVGVTMGQWQRDRHVLFTPINLPRELLIPVFFSFNFLGRFITGILSVAAVKAITGAFLPKMLKSLFDICSGSLTSDFAKIPPLLAVYKFFCYACGLLLGKSLKLDQGHLAMIPARFRRGGSGDGHGSNGVTITMNGTNSTNATTPVNSTGVVCRVANRAGNTNATTNTNTVGTFPTPARAGSARSGHEDDLAQTVMDTLVKTAEDVAFGSPTILAPPCPGGNPNPDANVTLSAPNTGSAISSAMGQTGVAIGCTNPDREGVISPTGADTVAVTIGKDGVAGGATANTNTEDPPPSGHSPNAGRYWSLRNHQHWWEHEIQSKYLNYTAIGYAVSFVAPIVINRVWGKLDYSKYQH